MFVRDWEGIPDATHYPADLEELGFDFNLKGQLVDGDDKFFEYHVTGDRDDNERRQEAVRECVRDNVKGRLVAYDIKEIYLTGEDGTEVKGMKPNGPHVNILATDLAALGSKSDVVVVIGERKQDLGIFSWRELLGAPGIERGSAVGLVEKLQRMDLRGEELKEKDRAKENKKAAEGVAGPSGKRIYGLPAIPDYSPGLIILNPGQLLYSNDQNKNMSEVTWLARPKIKVTDPNIEIHDKHNRVVGHENPQKHVNTVLEHVIPELVKWDARIWIIGIQDGAEYFINYVDAKVNNDVKKVWDGKHVKGIAFVQPSHNPESMKSDMAKLKSRFRGKTWQMSADLRVGDTISLPELLMTKSTDHEDDEEEEEAKQSKSKPIKIEKGKNATSSSDEIIFTPPSIDLPWNGRFPMKMREAISLTRPRANTNITVRPPELDEVLANPPYSARHPLPAGYAIPPLNIFAAKKDDSTSAASLRTHSSMSSVVWPDPTSISYLDPIGMSNSSLKDSDGVGIVRHGTPKTIKELNGRIDDLLAYQQEPSAPPLEDAANLQDPGVAGGNVTPSPPSSTYSIAVTSESRSSSKEESGLMPGGDFDGTEGLTMKAVGSRAARGAEIVPLALGAGGSRPRLTKEEEKEGVAALTQQLTAEGVGEVVEGPFPETGTTLTVSAGWAEEWEQLWGCVEDDVLAFFEEMAEKEF